MACKLPVALNTDMWSIAFRYSTFIILFLTSYYIVSKWWLTSERKKKTSFFSLVNFGSGWTARAKLLLSVLTWRYSLPHTHVTYHTCDLDRNVFKMAIDLASKKNWFCRVYHLFAHPGFFDLRGMYWDKNKQTKKQTKMEKFAVSFYLNH